MFFSTSEPFCVGGCTVSATPPLSAVDGKYSSHLSTKDVLTEVPDQDDGNQTLPTMLTMLKEEEPALDQEVTASNLAQALYRNSDSNLSVLSNVPEECYSSSLPMTTSALTYSPHSSVLMMSIDASQYAESIASDRIDSEMDSAKTDDNESTQSSCPSKDLLRLHLFQKCSLNTSIHFDTAAMTDSNGKVIAVSHTPLKSGAHEWTLEIVSCDVDIAEIGVCSVSDIDDVQIHDDGVTETAAFGARAVYGSELATDSVWYAAYNENGDRRCFKDLKEYHHIGWTCKDQIKVVLDLEKWRIKFYLNGQRVWALFCFYFNASFVVTLSIDNQ